MNLVRKQTPFLPALLDDLLHPDWSVRFPSNAITLPAVNIKEHESQYEIELAIPGKKKKDFEIEMNEGILSISSTQEEDSKVENGTYTRREFSYDSFRRSFTIPDSVDPTKIDAHYSEGVLQITLPKRAEALPQPKKQIKIR